MTSPEEPALHIEALRFRWHAAQQWTLHIPALRVARGEGVFVAGPSGSGKTTLLSLISGIVRPDSGDIRVLGTSLPTLGGAARDRLRAAHIGLVFQLFNLLPYLSVVDNVLLGCRYAAPRARRAAARSGTARAEALRLLGRLGLADPACLRRRVTELSVGQQQRVAAARALIGAPELVIADEATSALDADTAADFMNLLLTETHAAGSALLFVSHQRALAAHFTRSIDLRDYTGSANPA